MFSVTKNVFYEQILKMAKNISHEFVWNNTEEKKNLLMKGKDKNELLSKKHKKGLYDSKLY